MIENNKEIIEEIFVNITSHETRVAILENAILQECYIERTTQRSLIGNIYKGKVTRLMPGLQAVFVDIGLERTAFLHTRETLQPGQSIWVQVYQDPVGEKGARVTTRLTLTGRYLVLTPHISQIMISQKIIDEKERIRLHSLIGVPSSEGGYIVRTAAQGASSSDIEADKQFLAVLWKEVMRRGAQAKVGALLHQELTFIFRVLRDLCRNEQTLIRVDSETHVAEMQTFAHSYMPRLVNCIQLYQEKRPLFDYYEIEKELQRALHRYIYLKSGGYLVFDQSEAMTTVDVNTGSCSSQSHPEQTIIKVNMEAVNVIVQQIRLRNLSGMIIIDFIDMPHAENKKQLLNAFNRALSHDRTKTEVNELSSLGLLQMTRKRTRNSLKQLLCEPCPLCQQRGSIKSIETMCYEMIRGIQSRACQSMWPGFLVVAHPAVVDYISKNEKELWSHLAVRLEKPLKLEARVGYAQECYDIFPLTDEK